MESFRIFSAGSANDDRNTHLWLKGASLFIPQINKLLEHTDYTLHVIPIEEFKSNYDTLGYILSGNGSDKSNNHNYHILYSYIFNKLGEQSKLQILEIGLGTNNPNLISTMGMDGRPGASLYAFRDYLPNANIYGCDIDTDILFESERIKTYYVDQLELKTFDELSTKLPNVMFDLIIDDGLHSIAANFNTLLFALQNLNINGWFVVEDIHIIENWKSIDFILRSNKQFKTYIIRAKVAHMYAVQKVA